VPFSRRFGSGRSFSRGVRRKSSWIGGPSTGVAGQEFTASGKFGADFGTVALVDGITLVRTRGSLLLRLVNATAQNNGFNGAFGLAVVTEQAFSAGTASMPGPVVDEDWDGWLYHQFFNLLASDPIDGGALTDRDLLNIVGCVMRVDVDSKAMRKIGEGFTLAALIEVNERGTATLRFDFQSRFLVKLA